MLNYNKDADMFVWPAGHIDIQKPVRVKKILAKMK